MNAPFRSALLALAIVVPLLPACSGTRQVREGMSREDVVAKLGRPLRIEKQARGRESWFYNTVVKSRTASWHNNYERPGESLFERELRIEMADGVSGGVEFATTESSGERALHFDASGRLLHDASASFVRNDER